MAITKLDWIKDTDWHEAHLTPRGWWDGTDLSDKGYVFEKEPPADRLMTVRRFECILTDPNRVPQDWSEIRWLTDDVQALERAQARWGVLPDYYSALSAASASDHVGLKNVRTMRQSKERRPGRHR